MVLCILLVMWLLGFGLPGACAHLIGPVNTPTQAKEDAWDSVHEPADGEDYIYEDDRLIVWFDVSSGGFPRGIWLKDKGRVLRSKNSKGIEVPTNLMFGAGYSLIANLSTKPDSPYENFMIFFEKSPGPGLYGQQYVREGQGYTDVGFTGQLKNNSIKPAPGFDPNTDEITPDHLEPNPFIAQSWPKDEERWVHVGTSPVTHKMRFEKMRGDGTRKEVTYRIRLRIHHNLARFDTQADVFLKNRPKLDVILLCMETLHEPAANGSSYVQSLGLTGLDTASFDASRYRNWLGIPPAQVISSSVRPGRIARVKHTQKSDYPGNGATSFVVLKPDIRSPWIEITNGSRDRRGKVSRGLDVTIRRDFTDTSDLSHFGFTDTPWRDGKSPQFWWISSEAAFSAPKRKADLETRTLRERVSFRLGR